MDRLLNIKEAALFLNVSEMSIRRWTNQGVLKCYRVGGKRERRFYMRDLQDFLKASRSQTPRPLGSCEPRLSDGDHVTHFYSGKKEGLDFSVTYVLAGLKRGERVLVVLPPERHQGVIAALELQYPSTGRDIGEGRIIFSEGKDSPEEMIRYLGDFVTNAEKFRVLGDMFWSIRKGWDLDALSALEQAPALGHPFRNGVLVCQYGLEEFSGAYIMMAAEAHEQIIYKNELKKSPYYRPENKGRNHVPVI
ncbi:MAG: MEDS domain-containing protein [Desulfosalsimonadaceae bacterium]|nr:MEDS domain-containing protein [Desulfosalsimonadaceae bacterium]